MRLLRPCGPGILQKQNGRGQSFADLSKVLSPLFRKSEGSPNSVNRVLIRKYVKSIVNKYGHYKVEYLVYFIDGGWLGG